MFSVIEYKINGLRFYLGMQKGVCGLFGFTFDVLNHNDLEQHVSVEWR